METWDKLDDISMFIQTKNMLDTNIYFMQRDDKNYFQQQPHNKKVRITLRNPNDGKQFVMERILRRQIEERDKINHDAILRRNKKYKQKPRDRRQSRFKTKRSRSPRRKNQRSPVRRVPEEECDQRSSSESRQSGNTKRSVSPNTGVRHVKDVGVQNFLYNVKGNRKEDKFHPQNFQHIPLYRTFSDEEKQLTKEVKYVRISALSPRCFARQNLSNTHGMYEADGYFSEEHNISKLPSLYRSENDQIARKEEMETLMSPKPEVVHYTDGYRVGSIEVFEPIYILNSLCKNSRQPGGMTPRSEVSSLHHRRYKPSSERRGSLTSNTSRQRRMSLASHSSSQKK